ncbi:MAG: hypothetical protein KF871_00375 [Hydrogenophaga sp.]|uniref:DUF6151 family protein n=1 Tax=Hydrogenophaga sp. TaxID=1904254 RepID=UPI001DC17E53|nr:DUF6151 family protein [Hydrogenophaga sp.]MBX3608320.1 hypothetical protein [Hydrogenophaga sp.]
MNHPLRCACGAVQGRVEATRSAGRAVCYCRDCQAFARFLGDPADTLDALGGTEVVATRPRYVVFTAGLDQLRCMSLSERGLLRWYTACCHTPIGNTPRDPRLPYVGLLRRCLPGDDAAMAASFGADVVAVNTQGARGPVPRSPLALARAMFKILRNVVPERLSGRYRESPFFRPGTLAPLVAPQVIGREQRRALSS